MRDLDCPVGCAIVATMNSPIDDLQFCWPHLRVVMEGLSILDVPRLQVKSMEEATHFIQAFGFDPIDPQDIELIWSFFEESVAFIDRILADPEYPRVPEHLRTRAAVNDIRRLLLLSSESGGVDQLWACALLRVMHVLIHLAHDPRLRYFDQVQKQVLSRLDNYLYVDPSDGATYLGTRKEPERIKLLFFKKKDRKDRDRETIKLLHKAANLVEEIYDRIGFRLVTETKFDAIRAIRLLLEKNIVSLPNIRPGRTRNQLVDLARFREETDRIRKLAKKMGNVNSSVYEKMSKRLERRIGIRLLGRSLLNPHSSEFYHAIQFTCRELVKVRNPMYHVYSTLKSQVDSLPEGSHILAEVFPRPVKPSDYVFFPFEIQIMDVKSYADSIFGKSNHEEYRRKQLEAARTRVFGKKRHES